MNRPTRKNPATPHPARPAPGARPEKAALEELISKIKDLVSESPEKAARILGDWSSPNSGKKTGTPSHSPAQSPSRVRRKAG